MVKICTSDAITQLDNLLGTDLNEETRDAILFAKACISKCPARHKYKYMCSVSGDASFKLEAVVYADGMLSALNEGRHIVFAENTSIRNVENERAIKLA